MAKSQKDLWTSVSAIEDAGGKEGEGGCLRRWWFNKCMKLPTPKKKATIFGDVHHAVLGRFYMADDRGMDASGQPVNLYPAGWRSMQEKYGNDKTVYTISDAEESLIRVLVNKALEEGVLVREPGRRIELPVGEKMFTKDDGTPMYGRVIHTEGNVSKRKVVLVGSIDLDTPLRIEDHKTAKDTNYILSCNKLHKNIQIMAYAMDKYLRGHKGNLWLAHNNYIKDFDRPQVIKREIEVSEQEVFQFFADTTLPLVKKMFEVYKNYPKDQIMKWRDVAPPNNCEQECNHHYGKPCPFLGICTNTISVNTYLSKYGESIENFVTEESDTNKGKGVKVMSSLIDKIKAGNAATVNAGQAAAAAQVAAPAAVIPPAPAPVAVVSAPAGGALAAILAKRQKEAAAVVTPPAPVVEQTPPPVKEEGPAKQRAPWFNDLPGIGLCTACRENDPQGFSTSGDPCRICDARNVAAGLNVSSDYDINVDETTQQLVCTLKPGIAAKTAQAAGGAVSVVKEATVKVNSEIKPEPVKKVVKAPVEKAVEKVAIAESAINGDGFTLLLGCALIEKNPNGHVVHADQLLADITADIEKVAGKPAATIEHFSYMSGIDAYIPQIVEANILAGKMVVSFSPGKGTALARLVDGLRPHAKAVIAPLAL